MVPLFLCVTFVIEILIKGKFSLILYCEYQEIITHIQIPELFVGLCVIFTGGEIIQTVAKNKITNK